MTSLDRSPRGPSPRPSAAHTAFLTLLTALLTLQSAAPGAAHAFSDVIFFGDSLSDTGNVCAGVSSSGVGYAPGRCSNGPVWSDYFVEGLGFGSEATSSASGGSNYAVGGARSFGLAGQIDAYTTAEGGAADPGALHVIWLGGNDAIFELIAPTGDPNAMQAAAARIGGGVETLAAAGAQHFLVASAPDPGGAFGNPIQNPPFAAGSMPFDEPTRALLTGLALELNTALSDVLSAITGVSLLQLDTTGSFDDIIDEPAAYGFSPAAIDTTSQTRAFPIACLADPVCAADPQGPVADGFLIFDSVHPTTALHQLIAEGALAAVVPEPSTALCVGVGLVLLARRRRGSAA